MNNKTQGKINNAAERYVTMAKEFGGDLIIAAKSRMAFKDGANYVLSLPLTEKLTEDEKNTILELHGLIDNCWMHSYIGSDLQERITNVVNKFTEIFGDVETELTEE